MTKNFEPMQLDENTCDVVIIGAGFSGLYMLHKMKELGLKSRVLEAAGGVGGVWYWNRYPGARCDVESLLYSYQFSDDIQQEWNWTERFASQPEILRYLEYVADTLGLIPDIQFNTRVESARYHENDNRWRVRTEREVYTAKYCIMAVGCLSAANMPEFEGMEAFRGESYHTGKWPHAGVDFSGKTVGVIGTGSSGIQSIPLIARQAKHLYVFQRTASYTVPACNAPLSDARQADVKANYRAFRQRNDNTFSGVDNRLNEVSVLDVSARERERIFEQRWRMGGPYLAGAFSDLMTDKQANELAAEFVRGKIRQIVSDPAVAELLCPDQVIGCKRLCFDTDYYQTYNRPNVTLVDVKAACIEKLTTNGLKTSKQEYALDALVFATGYDAITGALLRIDISGRSSLSLRDKWSAGPRAYLGLATAGFPNLFMITGPGSPAILGNNVSAIERDVEWIAHCIRHMQNRGYKCIEADKQAEAAWVEHVNETAADTLFQTCNSWYLGANIPGKPRVFIPYLGGVPAYVEKCKTVAANAYEGFVFDGEHE